MIRPVVLLAMILPSLAHAAELPNVSIGPLSFNNMPVRDALETVLVGTEIKPIFKNELVGTLTVNGITGPLPEVMWQLSKAAGFQYSYDDKQLAITSNKLPKVDKENSPGQDATIKTTEKSVAPVTKEELKPVHLAENAADPQTASHNAAVEAGQAIKPSTSIRLKKGDSIHAALEVAATDNHYILNWDGEELYSKYEINFESSSFDQSVDSLLTAIKVNGYIAGNIIYVVVK